ncbi:MAG: hypothetical protein N3A54_07410 [Patescibacteria group bacterium]|nr:hypothetical protein [Patescibacteria group bacterium]
MNWIKSLFSTIWGGFKKVLPDKVKSAVVSYFSKNEKVLILLEPAMSIVKTVALSYGAFNVVAVVSAIQRTLSSWGIVSPPTPIQQVLAKGDAATVEEIKVALRELSKVL